MLMQRQGLTRRQPSGSLIFALVLLCLFSARAATREKVLHAFSGGTRDGCLPNAGLIFDAVGNLYGTTISCSTHGSGIVFELASGSKWTETVLHSFGAGNDARDPWAGLVFDAGGNLYGTTHDGGLSGAVFQLTPSSSGWKETVLHRFNYLHGDGSDPFAGLVLDQAGNLYGTTSYGGKYLAGTVFGLKKSSSGHWKESILHNFGQVNDGGNLQSGLIWGADGSLYGTTTFGGSHAKECSPGCGTVFKLTPTSGGWKEHILYSFNWVPGGRDGYGPYAGVAFDAAGNLYGTTAAGGTSTACVDGCGTVFKLTSTQGGGWKESILHEFDQGPGGNAPFAGVVVDKAGNLYGTTVGGGIGPCQRGGCGVVFKLAPSQGKWTYSVLYRFTGGADGAEPFAPLIFDSQYKHLYGTTTYGGAAGQGVVFEITP